jgi:hypothetical protein
MLSLAADLCLFGPGRRNFLLIDLDQDKIRLDPVESPQQ